MATSGRSSQRRSREAGRERPGARAAEGGCRRKEEAGPGTPSADMDLHCDGAADPPAAEPPAAKINKAAFKLFKKRKSGGALPSLFGVKNKGDGKSSGKTGMVRSKTHDGLAEVVVLEGGKKEDPSGGPQRGGGGGGGDRRSPDPPRAAVGSPAPSAVAKSHSFFSLLKKNGRSENGRGEPADAGKAGGRQKRGLKGLFSGVRWPRKDKRAKEDRGAPAARAGLILPGSLTASLECVKPEAPRPPGPPADAGGEPPRAPPGEPRAGEAGAAEARARKPGEAGSPAQRDRGDAPGDAAPGPGRQEPPPGPPEPRAEEVAAAEDASRTGCGDIIADQEEEAGASCDKSAPGPGKQVLSQKTPGLLAYQGGGEEMASPDEVDDTYLQEFWDMLSQTEGQGPGPREVAAKAAALETKAGPEAPQDARGADAPRDASSVKRRRLHRIPTELQQKAEAKAREKEPQEGVPNSDEGYWDSTTPGPEEDGAGSGQKAGLPRDSCSGDALFDLDAEPDDGAPGLPATEETSCLSRLKPVSPVTITCPLRTPGSLLKDSKIPISIKHLANLPASHTVVPQQPARSEMPRTKIPVSKVLVRKVSSRGLAGTTLRAAACHDSAKKL